LLAARAILPEGFRVRTADVVCIQSQRIGEAFFLRQTKAKPPNRGCQDGRCRLNGFTHTLTRSPCFRFQKHLGVGGDPRDTSAICCFHRRGQEFVGSDDGLLAHTLQGRGPAPIESSENLLPLAIGERSHVWLGAVGLGGQRFQTRDANDRLAGYLGPGFHGGEPNPNAREGSGPVAAT